MKKKLVFALLVLILLLPACGKKKASPTPTPEAPDAGDEATITFAVFDWQMADYEDQAKAFEQANPDIHVRVLSINAILELDLFGSEWPDDAWQRLAARADVISLDAGPDAVEQGLVRDLTPLLRSDPNFQADDFFSGALESVRWDGGTWMLPTEITFDLIYYDKDAFDAAGLAHPQPGWTWDDFLDAARALTRRDGDQVTRWGFVQSDDNPLPFIEGRAGPVIDASTDPPTPRYDQPEVQEAARWYVDLFLKHEVTPPFESSEDQDGPVTPRGQRLIENKQVAMWDESSAVWGWRKEQGNRGVVPYPVDQPDAHTTPIWVQGLTMSAGTAHPDAAWRWMDFVSRQAPGQGGPLITSLPARRSVAETSGFWDRVGDELAAALHYAIDHSYVTRWRTGYQAGQDALQAVLQGKETLEDALAAAQTRAEDEIERARAELAQATPVPTFVVAAPDQQTNQPSNQPSDQQTITFSPGLGAIANIQAYRDAARDFEALHPGIHVEVEMPDFRGASAGLKNLAESADCFQWSPDIQDPANRAAILPLNPFLDAGPSFSLDDFYPALVGQFTWQGQLLGLPAELQPYVIEYNADLFDAAGLPYPALDGSAHLPSKQGGAGELAKVWTTDDLLDLARALTKGQGETKQYGFVPQAFEVTDLLLFMERRGAVLFDEGVDPPALTLNNPAAVEALQWYADLSLEHEVKPVFIADMAQMTDAPSVFLEREALVREGRAALWTSFGVLRSIGFGRGREGLNTGVAPLPAGTEGASSGGTTFGYFISANTEARRACWEWITFLTGRPELAQGVPARRSVAESDAYAQRVGAQRAAVYRASVAQAGAASGLDIFSGESWLAGGIIWLGRAYDQVVNYEASAQEALNVAQKLADDYRACVVARDAFSDAQAWQACMQEVDPTLPAFLFNQEKD